MRTRLLSAILFVPFALACGGPADPGTADAGLDAATAVCGSDAECSDGLFCNGAEDCDPTDDAADANGCVAAAPACGADGMCSEAADTCLDVCEVARDADGDGRENAACGGDDCDDADLNRFPGNLEICDADDRDEDCDASTFGFRDADGDGFPDAACCNVVVGGPPVCGDDCDDMRPGSNPDNPEVCNTRDDDCDGSVDEEVEIVLVADADGDGFGSAATDAATMMGCGASMGWQVDRSDCDDAAVSVHPGAPRSATRWTTTATWRSTTASAAARAPRAAPRRAAPRWASAPRGTRRARRRARGARARASRRPRSRATVRTMTATA